MYIDKGKPIGIIRRIDNLGRVVIPAELRRALGIEEGEELEMFCFENGIFMRKIKKERV